MLTDTDICHRLVSVLSKHTGIEWSFGYLGNTYGSPGTPAFRDDRTWYAFASHPGRIGTANDSIGGLSNPSELIPLLQGAVALALVLSSRSGVPCSQ